jgi:hypothetical protein
MTKGAAFHGMYGIGGSDSSIRERPEASPV